MICERALQPAGNYPTARPAGKLKISKNRPRTNLLVPSQDLWGKHYRVNFSQNLEM